LLALLAALLLAQSAPAAAPADLATPATPVAARFEAARARLLAGDLAGGAVDLEAIAVDPGAGEYADRAATLARLARDLASRGRFVPTAPAPTAPAGPDRDGRAELVLFSTLYGIYAAGATAMAADVQNERVLASLLLAGGGAGLGTSLWLTRTGPISSGRADLVDSSAAWAGINGTVLGILGDANFRVAAGISLASSAAGLTTAALLTRDGAPPSGTVAAANSGGIWGAMAGTWIAQALPNQRFKPMLTGVLLSADAGMVAGAWLGDRYRVSRQRAFLIDSGALVGFLAGAAATAIVDTQVRELNSAIMLAGLGTGLGSAIWFTRDWDDDRPAAASATAVEAGPWAAPLPDGRIAWGVAGRF
jgi:hypothetical protein